MPTLLALCHIFFFRVFLDKLINDIVWSGALLIVVKLLSSWSGCWIPLWLIKILLSLSQLIFNFLSVHLFYTLALLLWNTWVKLCDLFLLLAASISLFVLLLTWGLLHHVVWLDVRAFNRWWLLKVLLFLLWRFIIILLFFLKDISFHRQAIQKLKLFKCSHYQVDLIFSV